MRGNLFIQIIRRRLKFYLIPFWANEVNEKIENSFIPVSDTYPNDKFEAWTIEDFEKMKEKNNQIEVDKFVSIW